MDSYTEFLKYFKISEEKFIKYGIEKTIFPQGDEVDKKWKDLKERLLKNKPVYIRGYGRDANGTNLYLELCKSIFENSNIKKDPSNNTAPRKLIKELVDDKMCNYQVSHIWGRTKNPLMFEAPWNICYTPKLFDPFTGHEATGILKDKYNKMFLEKAREKYKEYIDDYNKFLIKHEVEKNISDFLASNLKDLSEKEKKKFEKSAKEELSSIK